MPEVYRLKQASGEQIFPHRDLFLPNYSMPANVSVYFKKGNAGNNMQELSFLQSYV